MSDVSVELCEQLRRGDQAAVAELFARYAHRLRLLAERRLGGRLARRIDGEDIVQSVFRTFFRRTTQGKFSLDQTQQLWPLLVKITVVKALNKRRFHSAAARSVGRESASLEPGQMAEAFSRDPSPEEVTMLVDQIDWLLRGFDDPRAGEILGQLLEGTSKTEIAADLGISRQTVYRILSHFRHLLETQSPSGD